MPASPRRASAAFGTPMGDEDVFLEAKEGDSDDEVDLLKGASLMSPRRVSPRRVSTRGGDVDGPAATQVRSPSSEDLPFPRGHEQAASAV